MTLQNYTQYPTPTLCYFHSQYLIIIFTSILPIRLYTNICSNCHNITIYLPQLHQYLKYINIYHFDEKGIRIKDIVVVVFLMIDLLESSIAWR